MKKKKLVEIARSFSRKLNIGNFQSADFFCSYKEEVEEKDAEESSEKAYNFCKKEVEKSIFLYQEEVINAEKQKEEQKKAVETIIPIDPELEKINGDIQADINEEQRSERQSQEKYGQ